MTKYWIIIAKRYRQTLEIARGYIEEEKIWDFVSSNNDESRTPSNALKLQEDDKVLFYLAEKDRDGYSLGRNSHGIILYPYPIFFARATLASGFDKDKKLISLKDVKPFKHPIKVDKPKDDYEIGARGPTMLVEIKDYHKYEKVCIKAGVDP